MQHVFLLPGSEVINAFLEFNKWCLLNFFAYSQRDGICIQLAAEFPDKWHLVNVHEYEKNIPYIIFSKRCDHATNLSAIRTEYLLNSKKNYPKYDRAYNKYTTIYHLNIDTKKLLFFYFTSNHIRDQEMIWNTKQQKSEHTMSNQKWNAYCCYPLVYEGRSKNKETVLFSSTFINIWSIYSPCHPWPGYTF